MAAYEAWGEPGSGVATVLIPASADQSQREISLQPGMALLRTFLADSWEEACRLHCEANGWEEYRPAERA